VLNRLGTALRISSKQTLAAPAVLAAALLLVGCAVLGNAQFGNAQRGPQPSLRLQSLPRSDDIHVVLLALDGVRLREVFEGSDLTLVRAQRVPVGDHRPAREIMPQLHALMHAQGTVFGVPDAGSRISASGPSFVSLPGYTEMLTGRRVSSCQNNDCRPGARTLLDDCASLPRTAVTDCAAVTSWPNLERVVAKEQDRVALSIGRNGGATRALFAKDPALGGLLQQGARASNYPGYRDFRPDVHTGRLAVRYLKTHAPRFLFIGLGEPDEYAHKNDYAGYLRSLRAADSVIGQVARGLDELAARGARTALFVTTDHGRADTFVSHGRAHAESARVWLVASGTEILARGAQTAHPHRYLADIAPTIRRLLRVPDDLHPHAGQALHELFARPDAPGLDLTPAASGEELEARTGNSPALTE
jgi:hypothetical protein